MAGTTCLTDSPPRPIFTLRLETETRCDSFGTPGFGSRRFFPERDRPLPCRTWVCSSGAHKINRICTDHAGWAW